MKKLMAVAAVALCAAVTFGDEAISSANIVGFSTVTIKKGYNMLAVNFDNIGENVSVSIQDLFPGGADSAYTAGATSGAGDQIQVYNATTGEYDTYFLFKSKKGNTTREYKWVNAADTGKATEKTFSSGDSFWYYSRSDADFTTTIAGQVSVSPNQQIKIVNGYNMIGSAFPANYNPNTIDAETWKTSGAVAGATSGAGDQLQVYNATTGEYTTYFLFQSKKGNTTREWRWVNAANTAVAIPAEDEVLPVSTGAWYYHRGTGYTLTIASPITK